MNKNPFKNPFENLYENRIKPKLDSPVRERKEKNNKKIDKKSDKKISTNEPLPQIEKQTKLNQKISNNKNKIKEKERENESALIGSLTEAPDYLKDNEYIKQGYRINFNSITQVSKR